MRVKRRRFLQTLAAAPAVSAALDPQPAAAQVNPATRPGPPTLATSLPDATAETAPRFLSAQQFFTLRRLGALLMPPRKGHPGALDAGAPEFVDFLIGVSSDTQKKLYRNGLDTLNQRAQAKFHKPFADLDDRQADDIVRPLVVTIAWSLDRPSDPLEHFVAQAHDDLRTATVNSLEWATAAAAQEAGRRNRGTAQGLYIHPIDPVYRG
jgi:hypothetical protein